MTSNDGSATFTSVATRGIVKPGDGAILQGLKQLETHLKQERYLYVEEELVQQILVYLM